jgi:hypothetical protein
MFNKDLALNFIPICNYNYILYCTRRFNKIHLNLKTSSSLLLIKVNFFF